MNVTQLDDSFSPTRYGLIYVARFSNGKCYVGQTQQAFGRRKTAHKYLALQTRSNVPFHKAIRKYGFDDINWEIVEHDVPTNKLDSLEVKWIEKLQSNKRSAGYNRTKGGQYRAQRSVESYRKQALKATGSKRSEEQRKRISEGQKGKRIPLELRKRWSDSRRHLPKHIAAIIKFDALSLSNKEYCKLFDVKPSTVTQIQTYTYITVTEKDIPENLEDYRTSVDVSIDFESSYSPQTHLSWEDVATIRFNPLRLSGRELASMFSTNPTTVSEIQKGKTFTRVSICHLPLKFKEKLERYSKLQKQALTDYQAATIKFDTLGLKLYEYAELYGVSRPTCGHIRNGRRYKYITREHLNQ